MVFGAPLAAPMTIGTGTGFSGGADRQAFRSVEISVDGSRHLVLQLVILSCAIIIGATPFSDCASRSPVTAAIQGATASFARQKTRAALQDSIAHFRHLSAKQIGERKDYQEGVDKHDHR